jgi:hypothetical protein
MKTKTEKPLTYSQLSEMIMFYVLASFAYHNPYAALVWSVGIGVVVAAVWTLVTVGKLVWAKIAPPRPLAGDTSGLAKTLVRYRPPTNNDRQAVNTAALDWATRWDRAHN